MRFACRITKARIQARTHLNSFFTATLVTLSRLNTTLCEHCLTSFFPFVSHLQLSQLNVTLFWLECSGDSKHFLLFVFFFRTCHLEYRNCITLHRVVPGLEPPEVMWSCRIMLKMNPAFEDGFRIHFHCCEDGESKLPRNFGTSLPVYTASYSIIVEFFWNNSLRHHVRYGESDWRIRHSD